MNFIMRFLILLFISSCLIALGCAELDTLSTDLFADAAPDSTLFNDDNLFNEPVQSSTNLLLAETDPIQSMVGNDDWAANTLLTTDDELSRSANTVSSSLLAGSAGCDLSEIDDIPFIGKVRRGNACREPPSGQAGTSDQPEGSSGPDDQSQTSMNPYASVLALYFQKDDDRCPERIFGFSNIPVCKDEAMREDFRRIGEIQYIIFYLNPGKSRRDLS